MPECYQAFREFRVEPKPLTGRLFSPKGWRFFVYYRDAGYDGTPSWVVHLLANGSWEWSKNARTPADLRHLQSHRLTGLAFPSEPELRGSLESQVRQLAGR